MATISVCMIVKNEEAILARCLDCLKDFADEIIIIDTGSTDRTKDIAAQYTDRIYDFVWINDFAAARNYSFSKATKEYIYVADADEVIDTDNQLKLAQLKDMILPEIDVVQMYYTNQLAHGTTYNYDKEYRPKLFKRLRTFQWVDPIHETVELTPVVYDSDIEIIHMPTSSHGERDFHIFQSVISKGEDLSNKLIHMYARELYIVGTEQDFANAYDYFLKQLDNENRTLEEIKDIRCIVVKGSRLLGDIHQFYKNVTKGIVEPNPASEICYELGEHFFNLEDYKEATIWYYNAVYETTSALNIHYNGVYPLKRLAECYGKLGQEDQQLAYEELANNWSNKE